MAPRLLHGSGTVHADERGDHFEGLPADALAEAVEEFSEYNERLAAVPDPVE